MRHDEVGFSINLFSRWRQSQPRTRIKDRPAVIKLSRERVVDPPLCRSQNVISYLGGKPVWPELCHASCRAQKAFEKTDLCIPWCSDHQCTIEETVEMFTC